MRLVDYIIVSVEPSEHFIVT